MFSEKLQRERYLPHLGTFNKVKLSRDHGAQKHARLLSDIYEGTMYVSSLYFISQVLKPLCKGGP